MLRVVVRLVDGRIMSGYTPAFSAHDKALWLSPSPRSPAGQMITFNRAQIILVERRDGGTFVLPDVTFDEGTAAGVVVEFQDGARLLASQAIVADGQGLWIKPWGRPEARAFVPEGVAARLQFGVLPVDAESAMEGWDSMLHPSLVVEVPNDDAEAGTSKSEAPTPAPTASGPLVPPPLPPGAAALRDQADPAPSSSADPTMPMPAIEATTTQPDFLPSELEETQKE